MGISLIWRRRGWFASLAAALIAALPCANSRALAFDFFGLWGSDDTPPAISQDALPYVVTFKVEGDDKGLLQSAQDASSLYKLRHDAPLDGDSLARRAMKDFAPIVDALWGAGYYDASVAMSVDRASLKIGDQDFAAFSHAAESYRNRAVVPIQVAIAPGAQFTLRSIRVLNAKPNEPFTADQLPGKVIGLKPGDPASANELRAAQARMIDSFRAQAHPLAKVDSITPIVDHSAHTMDVTIVLDPGPKAGFGEVDISGPQGFDPSIVRSYIYIEPGDPYSPKVLTDTKTSIREIPAVGSVRITEAGKLDANGNLPIKVEVEDRQPYAIGASAKYSTTEGPTSQVYWEDRNVFGGAERLRLEGDLLYAPPNDGLIQTYGQFKSVDIGGRLSASFMKPALGGSTNDLLIDGLAQRVSTNNASYIGYTLNDVDLTAAIRHRFSDTLSLQVGVEAQRGSTTDILGKIDYTLIGAPISLLYDSTDSKLDPTRGVRLNATIAPYPMFLGSTVNLVEMKASGSTYYSLDEDSNYILAGRVAFGSLTGAALDDIPANMRFYAGGGGSVRGYAYQSVGPAGPGDSIIGGRSLFETSAELRVKITSTIGLVPFFDAGNAFAGSAPDFKQPLQMAAGLGFRYYTSIGPIRLDVAAPLNPRPGDKPVAVYVSIGQSF
ncbi:autotransporter assembly complex family protein [Methylocapsa sp. S129]|uniref:autotransporter assembly complex protein TamA n=1 Tax=Methylocapsa sp. S129 TaxID=1641869 RepID=UPI001FEF8D45|nr:autotransporter assembly complex family protein [Methylocapsa sp. S129]